MIRSPVATKSGTCTTAPVSSVAGFVTFVTVSPRTAGSVSATVSSTDDGSWSPAGLPSTASICTELDGARIRERVRDLGVREAELLERLLVHEVRLGPVVVQELHVLHLGVHARELLAGAERLVDDRARVERLQLRAHERPALPRLHVLELDDAPDVAVDLDVHPVPELVRVDGLGHRGVKGSGAGSAPRTSVDRDQLLRELREPLGAVLRDETRSSIRTPPTPGR